MTPAPHGSQQFVEADVAAVAQGCGCGVPLFGHGPLGRAGAARSRWGKLQPFAFCSVAGYRGF